jgi:hypothetical protein
MFGRNKPKAPLDPRAELFGALDALDAIIDTAARAGVDRRSIADRLEAKAQAIRVTDSILRPW